MWRCQAKSPRREAADTVSSSCPSAYHLLMSLTDALGLLTDRKPNCPYAGINVFILGQRSSANVLQHNQGLRMLSRHVWVFKKHTCCIMYAYRIDTSRKNANNVKSMMKNFKVDLYMNRWVCLYEQHFNFRSSLHHPSVPHILLSRSFTSRTLQYATRVLG